MLVWVREASETISGEVVKAILISISRGNSATESDGLFGDADDGNLIRSVDVSEQRTAAKKSAQLQTAEIKSVEQAKQIDNPDTTVSFEAEYSRELINNYATSLQGSSTLDINRFRLRFWETNDYRIWNYHMSTPTGREHFTGNSYLSQKRSDEYPMAKLAAAMKKEGYLGGWLSGSKVWGKNGVACSWMGELPAALYTGCIFDNMVAVLVPEDEGVLPALWCYCSSPLYNQAVRQINQKMQVANSTLAKVSFDLNYWTRVAAEKFPKGLPMPYTNNITQWMFHGHPCRSVVWDEELKWTTHGSMRIDETVLQAAVARLLGFSWPTESNESIELADEQRELMNESKSLASFADDDGIVCIPPVRGEVSASDRLLNLLAVAYGDAWSNDTLAALLKSTNHAGKTLETWLREKFFTQHCKLFQNRPFIWHIWDGLRDGFTALVNYHKLDTKLLETLIYTYIGDWTNRQKQDIASGVDGAQERLDAAESLKKKLEFILEGAAPYDIFVRWKPLEKQPIGWDPDLNDGVRLNIRPFLTVPDVSKKGAGVLRDKPNIKWNKDMGKEVESAPWYHVFKGDRINNYHLTLDEKRTARKAAE